MIPYVKDNKLWFRLYNASHLSAANDNTSDVFEGVVLYNNIPNNHKIDFYYENANEIDYKTFMDDTNISSIPTLLLYEMIDPSQSGGAKSKYLRYKNKLNNL